MRERLYSDGNIRCLANDFNMPLEDHKAYGIARPEIICFLMEKCTSLPDPVQFSTILDGGNCDGVFKLKDSRSEWNPNWTDHIAWVFELEHDTFEKLNEKFNIRKMLQLTNVIYLGR